MGEACTLCGGKRAIVAQVRACGSHRVPCPDCVGPASDPLTAFAQRAVLGGIRDDAISASIAEGRPDPLCLTASVVDICPDCDGTGEVSVPRDAQGRVDFLEGRHHGEFRDCQSAAAPA